ncbi:MAG: hypothetical protein M3371_01530 [Acidobacteriota bacterium]|nr:hypothetical protein [Acidobacteriota bacterium]
MKSVETQFPAGEYDPEVTLVAPRFDAREEVTARPVVPLADEVVPRGRRALPFWLLFAAAFIGGVVSVLGFYFYQRQQPSLRQPEALVVQPQSTPAPALVIVEPTPAQIAIIETVEETEAADEASAETVVNNERREDAGAVEDSPAKETNQPAKREERNDERERQPSRRVQRNDERPARRDDASRRNEEREALARPARRRETTETRPRTAQPRPSPTPASRNASRIRDIFEGVPPF